MTEKVGKMLRNAKKDENMKIHGMILITRDDTLRFRVDETRIGKDILQFERISTERIRRKF